MNGFIALLKSSVLDNFFENKVKKYKSKEEGERVRYSESIVLDLMQRTDLSIDEEIQGNILNFIRVIHLNQQDFIRSAFRSNYYGELPMTFRKEEGQIIGIVTATVDGKVRKYVFNDQGFEPLEDLLNLLEK